MNRRGLSALTQEELQGFINYHEGLLSAAITIKNEKGSAEDNSLTLSNDFINNSFFQAIL